MTCKCKIARIFVFWRSWVLIRENLIGEGLWRVGTYKAWERFIFYETALRWYTEKAECHTKAKIRVEDKALRLKKCR